MSIPTDDNDAALAALLALILISGGIGLAWGWAYSMIFAGTWIALGARNMTKKGKNSRQDLDND